MFPLCFPPPSFTPCPPFSCYIYLFCLPSSLLSFSTCIHNLFNYFPIPIEFSSSLTVILLTLLTDKRFTSRSLVNMASAHLQLHNTVILLAKDKVSVERLVLLNIITSSLSLAFLQLLKLTQMQTSF